MIRSLQRERDGSALYLSSIRPETKGFLLQRYLDTDEAVQNLPEWPTSLSNTRSEFDSSETFLKTLNRHRYYAYMLRETKCCPKCLVGKKDVTIYREKSYQVCQRHSVNSVSFSQILKQNGSTTNRALVKLNTYNIRSSNRTLGTHTISF